MNRKARTTIGLLLLIALVIGACSTEQPPTDLKTEPITDPETDYQTALAYKTGNGVEQDSTQAMDWLKKAGYKGHPTAQYELGQAYWQRGLSHQKEDRDFTQAAHWFRRAATQGHREAQYELTRASLFSNLHETDQPHDEEENRYWWRKAAMQGHPDAQAEIGLYYNEGIGYDYQKDRTIQRNPVEAYAWILLAREGGSELASTGSGFYVEEDLTPAEKAQAQQRAKELHEQIQANIAKRDQAN